MMNRGLYIHIPFCRKKCNYCDFLSFPVPAAPRVQAYLEALALELGLWSKHPACRNKQFTSIYFGGGTPTILSGPQLAGILQRVRDCFHLAKQAEITVEANPEFLDRQKLDALLLAGVNRLSLGVQSCHNQLLLSMGRVHDCFTAKTSFLEARKAGFANINIDLMYGLPGQSVAQWRETLFEILEWAPDHISAYGLQLEPGTPWYDLYEQERFSPDHEDAGYQMFRIAHVLLSREGFCHYEISNYAVPGKECIHNLTYWRNQEYLGVGLGASSFLEHSRMKNTSDIKMYQAHLAAGRLPVAEKTSLTPRQEMAETMFLGLRLAEGVCNSQFKQRFGVLPHDIYQQSIAKLKSQGLLEEQGNRLKLTEIGFPLANLAFVEFV